MIVRNVFLCPARWPGMRCRVSMSFELDSPERASAVASSLKVDDDKYVVTKVTGHTLHAAAEADNPKSLMHTLDDYISCASVAIKATAPK